MTKLVILKLDGDVNQGFQVTLSIGRDGEAPEAEVSGYLPPAQELVTDYENWQSTYLSLGLSVRKLKLKKVKIDADINSNTEQLCNHLNSWLGAESFRPLREKWLEKVATEDDVRVLIRTSNQQLRKLPWQEWDFLESYQRSEVALSTQQYEQPKQIRSNSPKKVTILAILGHSEGIDIQADQKFLESLPNAKITFLVEPKRQELNDKLWEQPWDILFFAGHSENEGEKGRIYINPEDSLTIEELKQGLRKAIANGLQLAIFNSCDGLGLARELEQLQIPQTIIMREPVADEVAQEFLKNFLPEFAQGKSLYASVLTARRKLQGLEDNFPCASWLPVIQQNPAALPPTWQQMCGVDRNRRQVPLIASVLVTVAVMLVGQLGWLQTLELKAFDHLLRQKPDESLDSRLLIVEGNQDDVNRYKYPLPDTVVAQVIEKLASHQPRVIGLDMYRNNPLDEGYQQLRQQFRENNQLIGICKTKGLEQATIPPAEDYPSSRLGFSDVILDNDNVLRRYLMFVTLYPGDTCTTGEALSAKLALRYLASEGIEMEINKDGNRRLVKILEDLLPNTGGYQNMDDGGFQILLNYRMPVVAPSVTMTDVITGKVKPELIKDKIVLIGVTAEIGKDNFSTPYSVSKWGYERMPGVEIHAHMVSQIISAVLDGRPLLQVWSHWGEWLWVWVWAGVGGLIVWKFPRPLPWLVVTVMASGALYLACWGLLVQGWWVPLVPSVLVLVGTGVCVMVYLGRK